MTATHRRRGLPQELRQDRRRRRHQLRGRPRRDPRAARPQRRGQDDDAPRPRRHPDADARPAPARRARRGARADRRQVGAGLRPRRPAVVRPAHGVGALPLRRRGVPARTTGRPRAETLLDRLELGEKRNAPASDLSRGMRQKLAVGCGWLHEPQGRPPRRAVHRPRPARHPHDEGTDPRTRRRRRGHHRQLAPADAVRGPHHDGPHHAPRPDPPPRPARRPAQRTGRARAGTRRSRRCSSGSPICRPLPRRCRAWYERVGRVRALDNRPIAPSPHSMVPHAAHSRRNPAAPLARRDPLPGRRGRRHLLALRDRPPRPGRRTARPRLQAAPPLDTSGFTMFIGSPPGLGAEGLPRGDPGHLGRGAVGRTRGRSIAPSTPAGCPRSPASP